jgi:hypothetical protein
MSDSNLNYLDGYCERVTEDASAFAEPLNFFTNIVFIFAAIWVIKIFRTEKLNFETGWDIILLSIILASIGIGSGLWHYYGVQWAMLADVIPIALFIHLFVIFFFVKIVGLKFGSKIFISSILFVICLATAFQLYNIGDGFAISKASQATICCIAMLSFRFNQSRKTTILYLSFLLLGLLSEDFLPRDFLNGTVMYLPTYLTIILMTIYTKLKKPELYKYFISALVVWSASLTFRTIDIEVCSSFPIGTHFMWHILNSITLALVLIALIRAKRLA